MYKLLIKGMCSAILLMTLLMLMPGLALAEGKPASTRTMAAGPYIVDINFYQDPPYVDHPLEVSVVPHNSALRLSGQIIAQPGLGTDATNLYAKLAPETGQPAILEGAISMPVRGAWQIVISLNGPQGHGTASIPVTVAAPGAIPTWLGWLIALTPMLGIAWWIWRQHRYRRSLLSESKG